MMRARRTRTIWGGWTLAGGLAMAATGCSQESAAPAPEPVAIAPKQTTPDVQPAPKRTPLTLPPVMAAAPVAASPVPVAPVPAVPAAEPTPAEKAFRKLVTPGVGGEEWETAHQTLIDLGVEAAPVLGAALASNDPMAREWAASVLALNFEAAQASSQALEQALSDDSGFVRANAAAALALVPGKADAALAAFLELLQSDDAQLRRMAAMNLSVMPEQIGDHVDTLTAALEDADPEVVQSLVTLLGQIGPAAKPALPKLQQIAARETDPAFRSNVEQAVELIEVE